MVTPSKKTRAVKRLVLALWLAVITEVGALVLPPALAQPRSAAQPASGPQAVDARIVSVGDGETWVYLFEAGTLQPVTCDFGGAVMVTIVASPAAGGGQPWGTIGPFLADKTNRLENGRRFPVWVVRYKGLSLSNYKAGYGYVTVSGVPSRSNVWSFGADPRAVYARSPLFPLVPVLDVQWIIDPTPPWPARVGSREVYAMITDVQPRIQPDLPLPSERVTSVDVYAQLQTDAVSYRDTRGSSKNAGVNWDKPVRLYRSLNSGLLEEVGIGRRRYVSTPPGPFGDRGPIWEFKDVDVTGAFEPGNHYTFMVKADGLDAIPIAWLYGAESHTVVPDPVVPVAGGVNCPCDCPDTYHG